MANATVLKPENQSVPRSKTRGKQSFKLIEKTYDNNKNSDYTECMEELYKQFKYEDQKDYFWVNPQLSILYGTPLYEAASQEQKLALNHLYWVSQYKQGADSEIETIAYNDLTADVFSAYGYDTIAGELEMESAQERIHIRAFRTISYQTTKALLGDKAFKNSAKGKLSKTKRDYTAFSKFKYRAERFLTNAMLKGQETFYGSNQYLKQLEERNGYIPAPTQGFFGRSLKPELQFFNFNWAESPFLASQYYTLRYMANMNFKEPENRHCKYLKSLEKQGKFTPIPTQLSRYHFLDEAFHTTTSLFMARDFPKDLRHQPTAYEKFVTNVSVYLAQRNIYSGLSGTIHGYEAGDDESTMLFVYKLLQSPLFGMSHQETLGWMEQCFCQEHEGFHVNAEGHKTLLHDIVKVFGDLSYLWPVNREMRLMAEGGEIERAIKNNIKTFKRFSKKVSQENK